MVGFKCRNCNNDDYTKLDWGQTYTGNVYAIVDEDEPMGSIDYVSCVDTIGISCTVCGYVYPPDSVAELQSAVQQLILERDIEDALEDVDEDGENSILGAQRKRKRTLENYKRKYVRRVHFIERVAAVLGKAPIDTTDDLDVVKDHHLKFRKCNAIYDQRCADKSLDKADIKRLLRFVDRKHVIEPFIKQTLAPEILFMPELDECTFGELREAAIANKIIKEGDSIDIPTIKYKLRYKKAKELANKHKRFSKNYLEKWISLLEILEGITMPKYNEDTYIRVGCYFLTFSEIWDQWQPPWKQWERDADGNYINFKYPKRKHFPNYNYMFRMIHRLVGLPREYDKNFPLPTTTAAVKRIEKFYKDLITEAVVTRRIFGEPTPELLRKYGLTPPTKELKQRKLDFYSNKKQKTQQA